MGVYTPQTLQQPDSPGESGPAQRKEAVQAPALGSGRRDKVAGEKGPGGKRVMPPRGSILWESLNHLEHAWHVARETVPFLRLTERLSRSTCFSKFLRYGGTQERTRAYPSRGLTLREGDGSDGGQTCWK